MFKTKAEFINWLSSQNKYSIKLHLTRVERACEILGHPEKELNIIHIAGTNGKGSTVNYLRSLLISSGFNVGIYISPYIISFNERIQVNFAYISDEDLVRCANEIMPVIEQVEAELEDDMTEFEIITVLSFLYFKKQNLDYVIYETGMGGRLDATNVLTPLISAITNVSYDHMNVLGNTLEEIASKKAGIAKANVPLLTTEENPSVLKVFIDYCKEVGAPFKKCDEREIKNPHFENKGMVFTYKDIDCFIPMLGFHQVKNAHLALNIYEYLMNLRKMTIDAEYIYNGLKNAKWGGRLEVVSQKPLIIIDGAHNIGGVNMLTKTMKCFIEQGYKIHTVFSALKDKETDKMMVDLQAISEDITLTSFPFPRAEKAKNLYEKTNKENISYNEDYLAVLDQKRNEINDDELLLITGSLYFIAKVIAYFK